MADSERMQAHKQAAVDFLQLVVAGRIEEAYQKHVDMRGKHHNPFSPAGFAALKQAMIENHVQMPHKQLSVRHVLGNGDMVAVHSHLVPSPGLAGMSVVHMFRFEGDRVAELWDVGQPVPADSPNADGSF